MKKLTILLAFMALSVYSQGTIAKDKEGLVVKIKEKYGGIFVDTCTVVMHYKGNFVLVRKDGRTSWYPASFHSLKIIKKLSAKKESHASDLSIQGKRRITVSALSE